MPFLRHLLASSAILSVSAYSALAQTSPETEEVDEIVVTGSQHYLGGTYDGDVGRAARAGLLGNLDYLDTPFSTLSLTEELVRDQQATSVTDVLRNDPTVQTAKGFGNFQEVYIIRGFPVFSDDTNYNGLFGVLPRQSLSAELIERVEVFRGANAFVNGASIGGSGAGGLINIVPKRADEDDLTRLTLGARSGGESYLAADVGHLFGSSKKFGLRANGVIRNGEGAIDDQERETNVLALAANYQGDRFRFSTDIGYQRIDFDQPRPQVTPTGTVPAVPDASANYAIRDTFSGDKQVFGTFRGEVDLTDAVSAWFAFGGRQGEENNVLANLRTAANGDYTASRFDNNREETVYAGDAGLSAAFDTGAVGHRLVASASFTDLDEKNAFAFQLTPATGNIYNEQPTALPPIGTFLGGDLDDPLTIREVKNLSAAVADTLSLLDERLLVTLGLRYQQIDTESFDFNTGASAGGYDESAVTPAAGIVFRATDAISVYGNYAENLQPGETAPAQSGGAPVQNAGEILDPFRGEQYEVGLKYDGGSFGASLSAFSLNRPSAIIENQVFSDNGEQRTRGIEAVAYGEIFEGLSLIAGVTLLDSELKNTQGGVDEGNTPVGVPDMRATLSAQYQVATIPGLGLDGRIVYSDNQFTNSANTIAIDDWTRLDLGASYTLDGSDPLDDRDIVLRLRVENVTDNDYWESTGGFPGANYLVQGEPRTVLASVSFGL